MPSTFKRKKTRGKPVPVPKPPNAGVVPVPSLLPPKSDVPALPKLNVPVPNPPATVDAGAAPKAPEPTGI